MKILQVMLQNLVEDTTASNEIITKRSLSRK
jgi:hypothetical protein